MSDLANSIVFFKVIKSGFDNYKKPLNCSYYYSVSLIVLLFHLALASLT